MPANLPPQYIAAEQKLKTAKSAEEKIAVLEEMWALLPKHKGTDKIQADIKRRISKFREDAEKAGRRRKGFSINVEREGAGQIVVVGPPNCGKSSVVSALTGAHLKVAPYPFTTVMPQPAMMPYQDVTIQLVDLPPIAGGHVEFWLVNIIRNADAALLVADAADPDCLEGVEETISELDRRLIVIGSVRAREGKSYGYAEKKGICIANKMDMNGAAGNLDVLRDLYARKFDVIPFSCNAEDPGRIEDLQERLFRLLNVIRIYPKEPGGKPDLRQPFTIREGSTVIEFAEHVHKDFAAGLKQARVWGSARFDGQAVSRDYILRDGDIVELSL